MAQNFIQDGQRLTYLNGTGSTITSGSPVFLGGAAFISLGDILDGASGELAAEGVFQLPKHAGLAISQGDALYWDSTPGEVTKTVTDVPLGFAHTSQLAGDSTVNVLLNEAGQDHPQGVTVAAVTAANASDLATAETLANANKVAINALIASLKAAGIIAS